MLLKEKNAEHLMQRFQPLAIHKSFTFNFAKAEKADITAALLSLSYLHCNRCEGRHKSLHGIQIVENAFKESKRRLHEQIISKSLKR